MNTICIIGAGNIGRRHLQGLLHSALPYTIYVVDTIDSMLDLAKTAIDEMQTENKKLHTFSFYTSITQLPQKIDIAIVATNANVRRNVVEQLLQWSTVKYLILEKVLFQSEADYAAIGKLIYQKKIDTFVNCTRRYFSHYQHIKKAYASLPLTSQEELAALGMPNEATLQPFTFTASGSNWGLACNVIHLLDIFSFICGCTNFSFATDKLNNEIIASKRSGFIELLGTVYSTNNDYNFSATCTPEPNMPINITISYKGLVFTINETAGIITCTNDAIKFQYNAIPLSQCSYLFINDLLLTGTCMLTNYFQSAQLHIAIIKAFGQHLQEQKYNDGTIVPIT